MFIRARAGAPLLFAMTLAVTQIASLSGCDVLNSAKATIVVAGLLVATPDITLPGYFNVHGETVATAYVADRGSATSTDEPDPISGASVEIQFAGNAVPLKEDKNSKGLYLESSSKAAQLIYQSGQIYAFSATPPKSDAGPFGGSVTAPTRLSAASLTYSPQPTPIPLLPEIYRHPKSTGLEVRWQEQNGRYAYVTVLRADAAHPDKPQVVFDSRPKSAGEMLRFIVGTPPTSVSVPADTFDTDGAYAVLVVVVNKGDQLPNTFLGSPILAGSGEKLILAVGNFMP